MSARRLLALLSLLVFVPTSCDRGSPAATLEELAAVRRPLLARLSIATSHSVCLTEPAPTATGGTPCAQGATPGQESAAKLGRLAATFRTADQQSARALHRKALWHLLWPEVPGSVDSAVAALTRSLEIDSTNVAAWVDLTAAQLAAAETGAGFAAVVDALDAAERAAALDERLPAARFNRALALERAHLDEEADGEWREYLRLDGHSRWAREAAERLAAVDARIAARVRPHLKRERLERDLLPAWAETWRRGDRDSAARALLRADSVARLLATDGDGLYQEAIESVQVAVTWRDKVRVSRLALGHLRFATGLRLYRERAIDSAASELAVAKRDLAKVGSPASGRAELYLAWCRYQHARYDEALADLQHLGRSAVGLRHPLMRAQALRAQGLIHGIEARYARALGSLAAAGRAMGSRSDPPLQSRIESEMSIMLGELGMTTEAWPHWDQALRVVAAAEVYDRLAVYPPMAQVALQRDRPHAALRFQSRSLSAARSANDPAATAGAFRERAEMLLRFGRLDPAEAMLAQASSAAAAIPDAVIRRMTVADILLVEGEAWAAPAPERALPVLDSALVVFEQTRYPLQWGRVHLARAVAHLSASRPDAAEREFNRALAKVNQDASALQSPAQRAAFLERARPLVERLVLLHVARGDTAGAWQVFESLRARDQPRPRVPPHVTLAVFALLERDVLVWVLRRDRVAMVRQPVPRAQIERATDQLRSALLEDRRETVRQVGGQLFELLLRPLDRLAGEDSVLVVIPDGALHFVPLAAFWDASRSRFAVERWEISIALNVGDYMQAVSRVKRARPLPHRILAVGDPSFDRSAFPLDRLAGSEREARAAADAYPARTLLLGDDATVMAFLRAVQEADVVHFAGHAVARDDAPSASFLLFAGADGALGAQRVASLRLARTRVVVLSACQTARGAVSWTEGPGSLARAFLEAGVPAVIASLWVLDDAATAALFERLHDALRRGVTPAAALRRAQLDFMRSHRGEPARLWAGLQLFGA